MAEREILFRGKLKDKDEWIGEWIEGIYCPCYWDLYMRRVEKPRIIILSNKGKTDGLWREVIPRTVGQYTGMTDNNGNKIFEGDIVDYISSDVIGNPQTGTIIIEDMTDYDTMVYLNHASELEIVGNIHDNPEILKNPNP